MRSQGLKRIMALLLVIAMTAGLCSCSLRKENARKPETVTEAGTNVKESKEELYGSPFINSMVTGNLPDHNLEARDDIYLHYNYDILAEHQGENYFNAMAQSSVIEDDVAKTLEDHAGKADDAFSGCSEQELKQLRILYGQAKDLTALAKAGISELEPYISRVQEAESLKEINDILASDDFPFSPFVSTGVSAYDMSGVNNVFIYPHFLFVDDMEGAQYLNEPEDDNEKVAYNMILDKEKAYVIKDLSWLGMNEEEAGKKAEALLEFEKSYGKDAGCSDLYQHQEYGALESANTNLSLEEVCGLCPQFPVRETLGKLGRDGSVFYTVFKKDWMTSFNQVWKEENLDVIKTMIMEKIISECRFCLDPAVYDPIREAQGEKAYDGLTNAKHVCNSSRTFAHLFAKIYVADQCSGEDLSRLTEISRNLIAALKELVGETDWLSERSKKNVALKLDKMRLNILSPEGGYHDFSDLTLTPDEEGGSLLGNYFKIKEYLIRLQNAGLGKKAQARFAWDYYPPTMANCFYDPDTNSVNIFPGFTASIGYDSDAAVEEQYGEIGWVIGHEISHGFDFLGSQLDADGTGKSIYDSSDIEEFIRRVDRLAAYYDTIETLPGIHVDGSRIKTEAAADLNGMHIDLRAVKKEKDFDYEKFFKHTSQLFAMTLESKEMCQYYIGADIHPLSYLRCNVNLQMTDELYDTYKIKKGDGMYLAKEDRILFWGR